MVPNSVLRLYTFVSSKMYSKNALVKVTQIDFFLVISSKTRRGAKKSQFFSITSEHRGPMVFELQEAAVEFQRSLGNGLTKA